MAAAFERDRSAARSRIRMLEARVADMTRLLVAQQEAARVIADAAGAPGRHHPPYLRPAAFPVPAGCVPLGRVAGGR